jgi:hypothetical protein
VVADCEHGKTILYMARDLPLNAFSVWVSPIYFELRWRARGKMVSHGKWQSDECREEFSSMLIKEKAGGGGASGLGEGGD